MSALDRVVAFGRVVGSALVGAVGALPEAIYNMTTIGDFPDTPSGPAKDADDDGEQSPQGHGWGPLGWFARPLDPTSAGAAEAAALRSEGQLNPIGWRDLRLVRALNTGGGQMPAKGQIGVGGYGSAFFVLTKTTGPTDILTLYVPHDFDGDGVAQKAHAISIDPSSGNSGITLVHANGMRVVLGEDGITLSADDETFMSMRPGAVAITATSITLQGNVALGRDTATAIPIALGTLAPSPSVFGSTT